MSDSTTTSEEEQALASRTMELCDEFSHFTAECAFICDAFAAIVKDPACINEPAIFGIELTAYKIKTRMIDINNRLIDIHEELTKPSE
ncbi:hypothetical protein SG34_012305 [Thalassomonas viridans]|uniref:Uncharacterized protein n=1 Tax=Thalassomonas viridans TaxID=137584 RepID=A0AAE9Z7T5_9GAMM|nr:hypothetical protein [Thalassomonas viridans]WDE07594.1 hypothetical protein SG34_012305 [Thalassomonas viridans]